MTYDYEIITYDSYTISPIIDYYPVIYVSYKSEVVYLGISDSNTRTACLR